MKSLLPLLLLIACLPARAYEPKAEQVVDNVYAIVGPLAQRNQDNDGLNNNSGFIVTNEGVILIDPGASMLGAEKLAGAIAKVSRQPVRWVINTGGQDHRWLGNDYFAAKGAELIALERTAQTQARFAERQMSSLKGFLGERLKGTTPRPATRLLKGDKARINLGGFELVLRYTDAHYPGDAWVWLPKQKVIFTGDLVYVDRLLGVFPWSSVIMAQTSFQAMEGLAPKHIVPGHGRVCGLKQARAETGDYYDFLVNTIGEAAREMEPMDEVINRYSRLPAFEHLEHYDNLHRRNMNQTFLEFEAM
ncbi:MAG: MBL fold metallo-hydrolase [Gammaproteobacteria bacterium]|nr:MBL fold metallo-hydrolase [Gammaproteobacteria bacterium]